MYYTDVVSIPSVAYTETRDLFSVPVIVMLLAGINRRLGLAGFHVFVPRRLVQKETVFVQYVYIYVSCCNCICNRTAIFCVCIVYRQQSAYVFVASVDTQQSRVCQSQCCFQPATDGRCTILYNSSHNLQKPNNTEDGDTGSSVSGWHAPM